MYEPKTIEQWIYTTLTADATLQTLLSPDNLPAGYQIGVYSHLAPQVDARSGKEPQTPYIVYSRYGGDLDTTALNGDRVMANPSYNVVVWDTSSGAISASRAQDIADRVDALLGDKDITSTTPPIYCQRINSDMFVQPSQGGRIDVGVVLQYRFVAFV